MAETERCGSFQEICTEDFYCDAGLACQPCSALCSPGRIRAQSNGEDILGACKANCPGYLEKHATTTSATPWYLQSENEPAMLQSQDADLSDKSASTGVATIVSCIVVVGILIIIIIISILLVRKFKQKRPQNRNQAPVYGPVPNRQNHLGPTVAQVTNPVRQPRDVVAIQVDDEETSTPDYLQPMVSGNVAQEEEETSPKRVDDNMGSRRFQTEEEGSQQSSQHITQRVTQMDGDSATISRSDDIPASYELAMTARIQNGDGPPSHSSLPVTAIPTDAMTANKDLGRHPKHCDSGVSVNMPLIDADSWNRRSTQHQTSVV